MDPSPRVLIVSPVKNEAAHLQAVIRAVAAQDFPPARWIVVDDGSSDGTSAIARRLAADIPFMDVLDEGPEARLAVGGTDGEQRQLSVERDTLLQDVSGDSPRRSA